MVFNFLLTDEEYSRLSVERSCPNPLRHEKEEQLYPDYRGFFIGGSYHGKDMIMYRKEDRYCVPITKCFLGTEIEVKSIEKDGITDIEIGVDEYELISVRNLEMESKFFNINLDSLKKLYRCDKEVLIYRLRKK